VVVKQPALDWYFSKGSGK